MRRELFGTTATTTPRRNSAAADQTAAFSQDSVRETAALANFVSGLKMAANVYFGEQIEACEEEAAEAEIECPEDPGMTCEEYIQQERETLRLVCLGDSDIAPDIDAGLGVMTDLLSFLETENAILVELAQNTYQVE